VRKIKVLIFHAAETMT